MLTVVQNLVSLKLIKYLTIIGRFIEWFWPTDGCILTNWRGSTHTPVNVHRLEEVTKCCKVPRSGHVKQPPMEGPHRPNSEEGQLYVRISPKEPADHQHRHKSCSILSTSSAHIRILCLDLYGAHTQIHQNTSWKWCKGGLPGTVETCITIPAVRQKC